MRKVSSIIIFLTGIFTLAAQSGTYHPLLSPEKRWVVATQFAYEQCIMYMPPWCDCTLREQFFIEGDTLIQSTVYQKCLRQGFSLASGWEGPFSLTAPGYFAALREDTIHQKVYIFDELIGAEVLMYDFTLVAGDSANFYWMGVGTLPMVVDSVTVLPDGRRKWRLNDYQEMVEGVGMGEGLFPQHICFEVCSYLACMKAGEVPYFDEHNWPFVYMNGPVCDYVTGTEVPQPSQVKMRVYPNPGRGLFFTEGMDERDIITVVDLLGRCYEVKIKLGVIDLSGYLPGFYWIKNGDSICSVLILHP